MSFSHGMNEDGKLYVPYSEVINNIRQLPSAEDETMIFPSRGCGKSIVIGAYKLGWKEGQETLAKENRMKEIIYRQDAIDAIVAWTVEDRPDIEMPTDLVDRVNALPSVERKGKWIEDSEWWYQTRYRCSECGKHVSNKSNYCPDCGAWMEERYIKK